MTCATMILMNNTFEVGADRKSFSAAAKLLLVWRDRFTQPLSPSGHWTPSNLPLLLVPYWSPLRSPLPVHADFCTLLDRRTRRTSVFVPSSHCQIVFHQETGQLLCHSLAAVSAQKNTLDLRSPYSPWVWSLKLIIGHFFSFLSIYSLWQ